MITILGPLFLFGCYVAPRRRWARTFYSFFHLLRPPGPGRIRLCARDDKSAPIAARARFLAVGLPVLAWSLLYAPCARALTGHGETLTAACRPTRS